jgi:hypothetical protein
MIGADCGSKRPHKRATRVFRPPEAEQINFRAVSNDHEFNGVTDQSHRRDRDTLDFGDF